MFIGRDFDSVEGATTPETLRKKDLEYKNQMGEKFSPEK